MVPMSEIATRRKARLRVLHVLDHSLPLHSGYSFRTLNILRGQRRLGWETFHLTSPKQGAAPLIEEAEGLSFFRTEGPAKGPAIRHEIALMKALHDRLRMLAKTLKPDLLHVHSPVLNALPALWVASALRLPLVYEVRAFWEDAAVDHGSTTEGSMRYRGSRALETLVLKRAAHVTTICQGLAQDIAARGVAAEKITLIPNAVDVASFAPGRARDQSLCRALGLTGKTVVGFIGSFYAYEGLGVLIDAFASVRAVMPEAVLLLVGGGPEEAALRAKVTQAGLSDAVRFTGRVAHEAVARHYDLIDLLVYPRLAMRLTELVTPIKPLEAMAQGRVVLASDVGGHRELIAHGRTGVLFQAGSTEALRDTLIEMIASPSRWPALAIAARQFVEQERTWDKSVARYQPVFEALCRR
ncbi:MAG: hypothetical protein RIR70_1977 [Pseudomonadota bacterium]|jgi:PEP-CTERM/exosortase A-associated glycosyltransferase